jgi:hypothetical protein
MRSNRPLTQFAVRKLEEFLQAGESGFVPCAEGNTSTSIERDGDLTVLGFWLHSARILELVFDGEQFIEAILYDGGFFDGDGRPSKTTRERLNGLLDALGEACLLPEGIRVYLDGPTAYVGRRGDIRMPLGRGHASVAIGSNPVKVEFLL